MPHDVVTRASNMDCAQGMPKSLTFTDHYSFKLLDDAADVDDDHDSDYDPVDDAASYLSNSYSSHSSDDDSDLDDDFAQPLLGLPTGVDNNNHNHNDQDGDSQHSNDNSNHSDDASNNGDNEDDEEDDDDSDDDDREDDDNDDDNNNGGNDDNNNNNHLPPEINIPNVVISSPPASPCENAGVGGENTGVGEPNTNPISNNAPGHELNNNMPESDNSNEQDELSQAMDLWYGSQTHNNNLRDHKPRKYDHLYRLEHMLNTFEQLMGKLFMMKQMSLKKGLKYFEKSKADAVVAKMRQLDYLNVIKPVDKESLTHEQKQHALSYLMYLKQKWCGHS